MLYVEFGVGYVFVVFFRYIVFRVGSGVVIRVRGDFSVFVLFIYFIDEEIRVWRF